MPYIKQKVRQNLDPLIEVLAYQIAYEVEGLTSGAFAGILNYVCTRLAMLVVEQLFDGMRYWTVALLTGVFKNISDEFYRRVAVPYEDEQIAYNGDVPEYSFFNSQLKS